MLLVLTVCPFYGVNIPSLARNLKMAAMLSWMYKDDLAFISHSLHFLRYKHTEPGEEPEDGSNVVLDVQKRSCFLFPTACPFYGLNIPSLASNLKMAAMLSWLYKNDLTFSSNSLPLLGCKHTEPGEEPYCKRGRRYCS